MKKMFSRMMSLILTLVMCFSMLNITAFAVGQSSAIQIVEQGGKVYYLAEHQEGEVAGEDNFDLWTSKTIAGTENEDEFEVTLQVGTTVKAVSSNSAVVLLMDASGSMMNDETGNRWNGNEDNMPSDRKRRIQYTREAALEFAQTYVENAGSATRMLSIVEFGNTAKTMLPWTNVNDGGSVNKTVEDAINSVEVNFTVDPAKNYWDANRATTDFGKVDYWDASEADAVMKDFFKSYFQSYAQAATMTSRFVSYVEAGDSVCKYPDCTDASAGHTHCSFDGCTVVEAHNHCDVEGCIVTDAHFHCTKCDSIAAHTHCAFEGCTEAAEHTHCSYEGCTDAAAHTHCERCGLTSADHKHIVGCTLQGCEATSEEKHIHACVYGVESCQDNVRYTYITSPGVYGGVYRCKNPDPNHTHEYVDSDQCYLTPTKYCGAVWCVGTNMEAGMMLARNLVTTGLEEGGAIEDIDNVYVILLSDGRPTWSIASESKTAVWLMDDVHKGSSWDALESIVSEGDGDNTALAEDIKKVAELYAILYTNDLNTTFSLGSDHPLNGVSVGDWIEKSGPYYVGADLTLKSPDADEISEAFASFGERINLQTKAWIATEKLSEHVTFKGFEDNGNKYAAENDGTISWNIGNMEPESGTGGMDDPYIYTLKYRVTLNSVEDEVKEISLAHDENDTLDGVWTNEGETTLKYFVIEKEILDTMTPDQIQEKLREAAFEDVSVKGLYADYEFIKKNKETDEIIEGAGFTLYDADGKVYGSEVFSDSEGKVTFTDIPKGEYTMKETTVPSGMQQMSDLEYVISWGMIAAKNGGEMDDVIYNIPIPIPGKINIFVEKVWNDSDDVDGKRPESITVQLMANGNAVSDKTLTLNAGNNWSGSFDNLDEYEGDIEIVYTIAEVEVPEGYESVITGDAETGFTVTNTYVTVEEDPTEPEDNIEIPDEDVPLAPTPDDDDDDEIIEIPDEDVPMADVPKTGDMILPVLSTAIASGAVAIFVGKNGKKRDEE